jgi:hypothetical protein
MFRNARGFSLAIAILTSTAIVTPSHATPPSPPPGHGGGGAAVVGGGGHGAAPWPVWVLGIGVVSLMLRAAVVYNRECRELTSEEAMTGMIPLWPAYHQPVSQCGGPVVVEKVRVRRGAVVSRY